MSSFVEKDNCVTSAAEQSKLPDHQQSRVDPSDNVPSVDELDLTGIYQQSNMSQHGF